MSTTPPTPAPDYRQPDHMEYPETQTGVTNPTPAQSDTPRTDALKLHPDAMQHVLFEGCDYIVIAPEDYETLYEHATSLERELAAKEAKIKRCADIAASINDPALPLDPIKRLIMIYHESTN